MRQLGWVVMVGLLAGPVWGQERALLRFFDCGTVRFFEAACAPAPGAAVPETFPSGQAQAVVPSVLPPGPPPPSVTPADALFTPETVAPTTPQVLLRLLQDPTEAHARAFLAWHQARLARLQDVQLLLQRLGQTQEDAGATEKRVPDSTGVPNAMPQALRYGTTASTCPVTPGAARRGVCAVQRP